MSRDVLIISTMAGAESCARKIANQVGSQVEVAADRKAGMAALRRGEFSVVLVDESLAESDPEWADQVWAESGLAIPVQMNFAISGAARLGREVKAALARLAGEQKMARREAVCEIENELKSTVTGLLLQSQLALNDPAVSASLAPKLRNVVELAESLRDRLKDTGIGAARAV